MYLQIYVLVYKFYEVNLDNKIDTIIQRYHGWIQYSDSQQSNIIPGEYFGHGGVEL